VRLTGSARRGDGELVWRLGAAARGGVLTREGVSGNVGEIWQLLGGEIEMWLTSIEGNNGGWGGGGLSAKRRRRWCCLAKTSEVAVFHCLGVVEASPAKEGGKGWAQAWMRERGVGDKGTGRCSALFMGEAAVQ
jgi:hypothetical protein